MTRLREGEVSATSRTRRGTTWSSYSRRRENGLEFRLNWLSNKTGLNKIPVKGIGGLYSTLRHDNE